MSKQEAGYLERDYPAICVGNAYYSSRRMIARLSKSRSANSARATTITTECRV